MCDMQLNQKIVIWLLQVILHNGLYNFTLITQIYIIHKDI